MGHPIHVDLIAKRRVWSIAC